MLPQGVIDGIVKYVESSVKQHIRLKEENDGKYVRRTPVIINTENNLMLIFQFENRILQEWEKDSEEEPSEEE